MYFAELEIAKFMFMSYKYKLEFDLSVWNIHDNIRFIESHNRVFPDRPLPFEHKLLLREELPDAFYLFDRDKYNLEELPDRQFKAIRKE